jgi:hypothetical protein
MKKLFLVLLTCTLLNGLSAQNTFRKAGIGINTSSGWLAIKPFDSNAIELRPFGSLFWNTSELRFLELAAIRLFRVNLNPANTILGHFHIHQPINGTVIITGHLPFRKKGGQFK